MIDHNESQRAKSAAMQHESYHAIPEPLDERERTQLWAVILLVAASLIGLAVSVIYFVKNS